MSNDGRMLTCGACGARNPASARFCNQCGRRVAGPAPEQPENGADGRAYTPRHLQVLTQSAGLQGERKQVTVLFADIKGSTRLAEQAGAERWHEILDRFFAILTHAIHQYAGSVNQYTGDGVMALFGAPRALEEHAQFAAHAALTMQRDVRRYADELRMGQGLNLSMRVGLNSGEVVVGRIGDDLRSDYTAQGPAVHLAARMEHLCEPGRVYLTRRTATLLEGYFRLRALGATRVHGVDDPVEVFELERDLGLRTRLERALMRSESPFVGREKESARLEQAFAALDGGRGQVVAVVGDAGIGKSRLCHEFATACARTGATLLRTSGVPYASRMPLVPFRALLRSKLGVPEQASPAEARRWIAGALLLEDRDSAAILPQIFGFLNIAESDVLPETSNPGQAEAMLQRLADFLPQTRVPMVLLVEDLHFLDPGSERLLLQLCDAVRRNPCLLLLNYRPDYEAGWLQPRLDACIELHALPTGPLEQVAGTLLGTDASLAPAIDLVTRRAAGNPYFVEEAVQSLVDGGWVVGPPGNRSLARPLDEWPVPANVQALLAARIDRLDEPLRDLLRLAAVLGIEFEAQALKALAREDDGAVDARIETLETLGLLRRLDDDRLGFDHPMVQEVAYGGQLETTRRATHRRVAEWLQGAAGDEPRACEAAVGLALHWERAGEWQRAGGWNLEAARWALLQDITTTGDQYRHAVANFDRAPDSPEAARGRVAARAGIVRLAQFAPIAQSEVESAYQEGRRLAESSGDVAAQAELQISYGYELLHRGQVDAAADCTEEAVQRCFANGETSLINRFRLPVLQTLNAAGRLRHVLEILDQAGGDWRSAAVDESNYMARGYYALMLCWLGRLDEAAGHLDAAIAYAESEGRTASWMFSNRVDIAALSGNFGPALAAARQSRLLAEQGGSPFFRAIALRSEGLALCLNGRAEEAVARLDEAIPLVSEGGNAHQFEANLLAIHAMALYAARRGEEAEAMARRARDSARRAGARIWEIVAWLVWLRLPVIPANQQEAVQGMRRVADLIEATGAEGFRPWLELVEGHWAESAGDRDRARARAQAAFERIGATGYARRLAQCRAQGAATVRQSPPGGIMGGNG